MRVPAGVPQSGNGKFIILALLLLGAIGGLAYWQLSKKAPDPVVLIPDAGPPPIPSKNPDDDIPPPPPSEDASVDAGKKTVVAVNLGNQCEAKSCGGSTTSDVETALAFRAKQAHRCYDNALAQDPTLRGKVSIAVRIGANGQACSAGVASNELSSAGVANCVTGYFRGQNFPSPRGGCVDVKIPISFVPRQ